MTTHYDMISPFDLGAPLAITRHRSCPTTLPSFSDEEEDSFMRMLLNHISSPTPKARAPINTPVSRASETSSWNVVDLIDKTSIGSTSPTAFEDSDDEEEVEAQPAPSPVVLTKEELQRQLQDAFYKSGSLSMQPRVSHRPQPPIREEREADGDRIDNDAHFEDLRDLWEHKLTLKSTRGERAAKARAARMGPSFSSFMKESQHILEATDAASIPKGSVPVFNTRDLCRDTSALLGASFFTGRDQMWLPSPAHARSIVRDMTSNLKDAVVASNHIIPVVKLAETKAGDDIEVSLELFTLDSSTKPTKAEKLKKKKEREAARLKALAEKKKQEKEKKLADMRESERLVMMQKKRLEEEKETRERPFELLRQRFLEKNIDKLNSVFSGKLSPDVFSRTNLGQEVQDAFLELLSALRESRAEFRLQLAFHGTLACNLGSIETHGLVVGGANKVGVSVRNGTALGHGIYTDLNGTTFKSFCGGNGIGFVCAILDVAGMKSPSSIYSPELFPDDEEMIFKNGPIWVVRHARYIVPLFVHKKPVDTKDWGSPARPTKIIVNRFPTVSLVPIVEDRVKKLRSRVQEVESAFYLRFRSLLFRSKGKTDSRLRRSERSVSGRSLFNNPYVSSV